MKKTNIKKALLASTLISIGLLTACGNSDDENNKNNNPTEISKETEATTAEETTKETEKVEYGSKNITTKEQLAEINGSITRNFQTSKGCFFIVPQEIRDLNKKYGLIFNNFHYKEMDENGNHICCWTFSGSEVEEYDDPDLKCDYYCYCDGTIVRKESWN